MVGVIESCVMAAVSLVLVAVFSALIARTAGAAAMTDRHDSPSHQTTAADSMGGGKYSFVALGCLRYSTSDQASLSRSNAVWIKPSEAIASALLVPTPTVE